MMKIARKYSLRSYISARGPDTQVRQKLFQKPQQVSRKRVSVCLWHQQHAILRTVESWMLPQREVSLSSCKVAITIYAAPKPCSAVNMPCLCYFTYPQHITTLDIHQIPNSCKSHREKHRPSRKGRTHQLKGVEIHET